MKTIEELIADVAALQASNAEATARVVDRYTTGTLRASLPAQEEDRRSAVDRVRAMMAAAIETWNRQQLVPLGTGAEAVAAARDGTEADVLGLATRAVQDVPSRPPADDAETNRQRVAAAYRRLRETEIPAQAALAAARRAEVEVDLEGIRFHPRAFEMVAPPLDALGNPLRYDVIYGRGPRAEAHVAGVVPAVYIGDDRTGTLDGIEPVQVHPQDGLRADLSRLVDLVEELADATSSYGDEEITPDRVARAQALVASLVERVGGATGQAAPEDDAPPIARAVRALRVLK